MGTPIYTGNGKKHLKFDGCISMGHSKEHLELLLKNLNEKGWVNTIISPTRNDPDKYYEKIDEYRPDIQRQGERAEQERQSFQPNDKIEPEKDGDGLPF